MGTVKKRESDRFDPCHALRSMLDMECVSPPVERKMILDEMEIAVA